MAYSARVIACATVPVGATPQYHATLEYLRDAEVLFSEDVAVDAATFPTLVEVRAELKRVSDAKIAELEDYDANAQALVGETL